MQTKTKKLSEREKNFEAAFNKYLSIVPKDYFDSFKKVEYAKLASQKQDKLVKERNDLRNGNVNVYIKSTTNKQISNLAQALNPERDVVIKDIPKEISTQVQQARKQANLSQEELARHTEVKVSLIRDLEAGVGAYDAQLVAKIEAHLKLQFTRSWKNNKLR